MEGYCNICGEKDRLFEIIDIDQIKSICKFCLRKHDLPLISLPNKEQMRNERVFAPSASKIPLSEKKPSKEIEEIDSELRDIVSENIKPGEYKDLIDNFHWHLQHARRMRKISPKQLSMEIAEPEVFISMAEKAQLPEDYSKFISKLEQYFNLQLHKNPKVITGISDNQFNIKEANLMHVTTTDLKNLDPKTPSEEYEDEIEILDDLK